MSIRENYKILTDGLEQIAAMDALTPAGAAITTAQETIRAFNALLKRNADDFQNDVGRVFAEALGVTVGSKSKTILPAVTNLTPSLPRH